MQAGLVDPILDSQRIFRQVLEAMAHPGQVITINAPAPVSPLHAATLAVALTLLDHETPVYLDTVAQQPELMQYLRFHCGCPLLEDPAKAMFAILADAHALLPLERFGAGSDEYPDHGATLLVQVQGLLPDEGLHLSGPGIADQTRLSIQGTPTQFPQALAVNHARFPRGVDFLFCCGSQLAALPRSTQVEE